MLQLTLDLLSGDHLSLHTLLLQGLLEPLLLQSLLLGQLLLQEQHLAIGVGDEHVELVLRQLAALLAQLYIWHDTGHLLLELLPAGFHQLPVLLRHLGLALDCGAFDLGLVQQVDSTVGLPSATNKLGLVEVVRFLRPAAIDSITLSIAAIASRSLISAAFTASDLETAASNISFQAASSFTVRLDSRTRCMMLIWLRTASEETS